MIDPDDMEDARPVGPDPQAHISTQPDRAAPATRNKRTLPEPRTWIVNDPDHTKFGTSHTAVFLNGIHDDNDRALALAAKKQHRFVANVRARIRDPGNGLSTENVATNSGMTVDQLRRILRGETHLTFSDYCLIALHTGFHVPGVRSTDPRAQP